MTEVTVNTTPVVASIVNKPFELDVVSGVGRQGIQGPVGPMGPQGGPGPKGDKVSFNGQDYESLIDGNAYSPSDYPAGWKAIA